MDRQCSAGWNSPCNELVFCWSLSGLGLHAKFEFALTSKQCWTFRLFLQMILQRWRMWWFQWTWVKTLMGTRPDPPPRPPVSRTAQLSRKVGAFTSQYVRKEVSCSPQSYLCLLNIKLLSQMLKMKRQMSLFPRSHTFWFSVSFWGQLCENISHPISSTLHVFSEMSSQHNTSGACSLRGQRVLTSVSD